MLGDATRHPRSDDEILTRLSTPERWADALSAVDARLVVAGHTHQQDDRIVGDVRFVNAGSVGLSYEGGGAARWLWIADGEPSPRATPYDSARAGERMLSAGWPDEGSINASRIEPVDAIAVTRIFEEMAVASEPAARGAQASACTRTRCPSAQTMKYGPGRQL